MAAHQNAKQTSLPGRLMCYNIGDIIEWTVITQLSWHPTASLRHNLGNCHNTENESATTSYKVFIVWVSVPFILVSTHKM